MPILPNSANLSGLMGVSGVMSDAVISDALISDALMSETVCAGMLLAVVLGVL